MRIEDQTTYPKRTPPKATNNPTMMAGIALPGAPSGFFNIKPMMTVPFQETVIEGGRMTRIFRSVVRYSRLMRERMPFSMRVTLP
jgi:hypothetical protein